MYQSASFRSGRHHHCCIQKGIHREEEDAIDVSDPGVAVAALVKSMVSSNIPGTENGFHDSSKL